jgi:hypothetical protein
MGWESRGNGRYYYRKRKVAGRVISEYAGAILDGRLMEQLDQDARQKATIRRKAWQTLKDREKAIDQQINEITNAVNNYVAGFLLVSGHHLHKRQWRKQRGNR